MNKKIKMVPMIFEERVTGGFFATFPGLPSCSTFGHNFYDTFLSAQDKLSRLFRRERNLPAMPKIEEMTRIQNSYLILVEIVVEA